MATPRTDLKANSARPGALAAPVPGVEQQQQVAQDIASTPPPVLAYQAGGFAKSCGAKFVIDTQDLWPEAFYSFLPGIFRQIAYPFFVPMYRKVQKTYKLADFIICTSQGYLERAKRTGAAKKPYAIIPLGLDYAFFNSKIEEGCRKEFTKPAGEIWFIYGGSLTRNHDFLTPIKAFAKIYKSLKFPARLFVAGQGYMYEKAKKIIAQLDSANIILTGFLDVGTYTYLLKQCDVGFNCSWPETNIHLPYKLFYYFAAGIAVLNTMPGECSEILSRNDCGLDYKAGNVDNCAEAIKKVINDMTKLHTMQKNSRHLAQTVYDRDRLYQKYIDVIEKL